jgi:hypothetical protein
MRLVLLSAAMGYSSVQGLALVGTPVGGYATTSTEIPAISTNHVGLHSSVIYVSSAGWVWVPTIRAL